MKQLVICPLLRKRLAPVALSGALCFLALSPWSAAQESLTGLTQTYFVPLPERDIFQTLDTIDSETGEPSILIESVISIANSLDDNLIIYDHWEDGYESNLASPVQASTQIWGDGNATNGSAPCCTDDRFDAGAVIVLQNTVDSTNTANGFFYNGRDRFAAAKPVAVTRVAWSQNPGTLLAGAVEVFPVEQWGLTFEAPLGIDLDSDEMFEVVDGSYMAAEDNTTINIYAPDGLLVQSNILNQGESLRLDGIVLASTAVSNKPVQLHVMTGDIGATYESRWAIALPRERWGQEYFLPVSTRESATADPTDVFLYNPDLESLTVHWETMDGPETDIIVHPKSAARVRMPNGSGARFHADKDFYAVATIDSNGPNSNVSNPDLNNRDFDWGLALVPREELSTQALVGFAPSIDPTKCDTDGTPYNCTPPSARPGSPVWVMSANTSGNTTVYVDFDGDPTTGLLIDAEGNGYDLAINLSPLECVKIFDNDASVGQNDNDNTGTLLYTLDGSLIAVAWGQDPESSDPGAPFFDAGTFIPALPQLGMAKAVDRAEATPGDLLIYTISVTNSSRATLTGALVQDALSPYVTYVQNSTTLDGAPVPDAGVTPFPLDEEGLLIEVLEAGTTAQLDFQVTINALDDPTSPIRIGVDPDRRCLVEDAEVGRSALVNQAVVRTLGFEEHDEALTCVSFLAGIDIEKATNGEDADTPSGPEILVGQAVNWTYVVTNTGEMSLSALSVSDSDENVSVDCPRQELAAGESMTCTASALAIAGQYTNLGSVTASAPGNVSINASDRSHYVGVLSSGGEGCTPGYWRQSHHFDSYPSPYSATTLFVDAFGENAFPEQTLSAVAALGGGGLNALGRHAVAALLNAASPNVSYDLSSADVIAAFAAVYPGSRSDYNALKDDFEGYNEQSCSLN